MKTWLLLLLTLPVHHLSSAQTTELRWLKSINRTETRTKNQYATFNSNAVHPVGIGVPAGITLAGIFKKDKALVLDGIAMSGTYLANVAATQILKRTIKRKRPYEQSSEIIKRASADDGLSFPSGHTSTAFATATSVSLRYKKWYYVVPSFLFATSVGWARMYQGVHYPSDVLAGAAVGSSTAWLAYKIQQKIVRRKPPPNPSTF